MNKDRRIVLTFVDNYLPGYRAGGPIRTVANLVSQLGDEFEFLIVTRDRDLLDSVHYPNILIDQWNDVGKAKVFYASPGTLSLFGIMGLLKNTEHEILYLNSFFSPRMSILPLVIRRLGLYVNNRVVIAPRGEFSRGALALKATKKKLYITFSKVAGLCRHLTWQASSDVESRDISRIISTAMAAPKLFVAPDLLSSTQNTVEKSASADCDSRLIGPLRVIFLSRISPIKNLDYLLGALAKVNAKVSLSIYGPVEDSNYWAVCRRLIEALPDNIMVTYHGQVSHARVTEAFAAHDVFILPTRGENFGHVIFEALAAGTSVIVSDQTPWLPDPCEAVRVLSLDHLDIWIATISKWAGFDDQKFTIQRLAAVSYAATYMTSSPSVGQNRNLFLHALGPNVMLASKIPPTPK